MTEYPVSGDLARLSRAKAFGGWQETWVHSARSTDTAMKFGIYLPPQADDKPCPVLYWLSGLTCTEENFIVKSGAQRYAAEHGLILVTPDTSPRGAHLPGEDDSWDFGTGAGFYLNATQEPWNRHYRMYDYVLDELPTLIQSEFLTSDKAAIAGHSMGGMAHWCWPCAIPNAIPRFRLLHRLLRQPNVPGVTRPLAITSARTKAPGKTTMPIC